MKTCMCGGVVALLMLAGGAQAQITGPSSSQSPYVLPSATGVKTISLLTVGDTVGGYRMVGIPDGMGAFASGGNELTLVVNHELGNNSGSVRAHGSSGAFVSRWTMNTSTLAMLTGRDHNTAPTDVFTWNGSAYVPGTTAWNRFCSGDLAAPGAYLFNDVGTDARIYLNGEESGNEGRSFAHVLTGPDANSSFQLPYLGRFSRENSVASPYPQLKTIVIGTDDTTPGQVYLYMGTKQTTGSTIERAGLTGGSVFGIRVAGLANEVRTSPASGRFDLAPLGDVSAISGGTLDSNSNAAGVTRFLRPEDGAWDPRETHHNDFYFVTTDRIRTSTQGANTRLYRLRFDDITDPAAGGTITALVDGATDGPNMMDNICVDHLGRVLMQEDIGGDSRLGKIWMYDTNSGVLTEIAANDPARFISGAPSFLTQDEEASGIFDASDLLGEGYYLLCLQAHYSNGSELVEGGQLLAMFIPTAFPCGTADFDGNGDIGTDADIEAFFACLGGNCCDTCYAGGVDFDGDGDIGTDADIEAFFRILAGGPC